MIEEELRKYVGGKYSPRELKIAINFYMRVLHIKVAMMLGKLKCKLGFHNPAQWRHTYKHKCRTTNKGRSKKRWTNWIREIVTVTYCERCGKTLRTKRRWRWR